MTLGLSPIFVISSEFSNTSKARLMGGTQSGPGWKSFGLKYKSIFFSWPRGENVSEHWRVEIRRSSTAHLYE